MRGLTVKPPWSTAIAMGAKRIENRSWSTPYRGPVAVHAGKAWAFKSGEPLDDRLWELGKSYASTRPIPTLALLDFNLRQCHHRGAVIAVAELVDCHVDVGCCKPSWGDESWIEPDGTVHDVYHWRLAHVRPLNPVVPARGALGLWKPTPELLAAIEASRVAA